MLYIKGFVVFEDIHVDQYTLYAQAEGHSSYSAVIIASPDSDTQEMFLERIAVKYTWTVTPTTVPDKYVIALESTFETQVPMPVVTVDPAKVNTIPYELGEEDTMEFTITNHGLIRADDVRFALPLNHPYLNFNMFEKTSHHSGINRSPYKAMFGCDAKIGLSSSSLPQEILGSLQTEEDLIQHFQSSDKPDEISNDKPNELSSDKPNELDEVSQLNAALNLSETQETELDVHVCAVCENPCFSNIQCSTCAQYIHELCSKETYLILLLVICVQMKRSSEMREGMHQTQ
ncbi:unnamed protein product [Mytilus edulis]|uniref:Uncharacterized protein n=1 Tax=Mytilus edulis TaxID=6550 RepID=A0A8S3URP2_MYTED|nr:unnamed protein product [Mytilus edulis]